jgi:hypothetical protein
MNRDGKMAKPLTNAILASIMHLIWRDIVGNRRVPPRRAPLRWVPPHQALARQQRRHPCRSVPRAVTPPPHYRPMEPSPPRVPKQMLTRPPEGTTPFTVARLVRNSATEDQERVSPAVEPLTRGMADLMISDQSATPYHRANPPSPTLDEANHNPNGSGSSSPPRVSPLGNRIIPRVIWLPTSTCSRPATRPPSPTHVLQTRRCGESGSATRNPEKGRGWRWRKMAGRSTEPQGQRWWWVDLVGVVTWRRLDHMVDLQ